MILYSKSADIIADRRAVSLSPTMSDLTDWIKITSEESENFYFNLAPEGKKRKPHCYPFEFEDIPPVTYTVEQLQQQAKTTRDTAISAPIELDGAMYQMDDAALANINRTKRKAEHIGAGDEASTLWRLVDNTWRETTLAELNQLIELADDRFESVWSAFNSWDAGDKSEPFAYE